MGRIIGYKFIYPDHEDIQYYDDKNVLIADTYQLLQTIPLYSKDPLVNKAIEAWMEIILE